MLSNRFQIVLVVGFVLAFVALLWSGLQAHPSAGADRDFAIAAIPPNILEDADAVVRLDELIFEVESPKKAKERVRRVVTIFNQKGREFGELYVYYDRFRKIKKLEGKLLDATGDKIRDLKDEDKEDRSAISNISLYDDYRVSIAKLYHNEYPYTVVFEYELERDGLISWPTWYPQWFREPVERAVFELSVPNDMEARYYLRGLELQPDVTENDNRKNFRWQATMLPKREPEPYGPRWSVQAPSVLTAPTAFEIADYPGEMSSWSSFGQWYRTLAEGRDELPPEAVATIKSLCAAAPTKLQNVKALYEHLQATTRYVSVQLGIGGWQPLDAEFVYRHGYGDCKALTNYMHAMLKAAGIESYPVLIRNGAYEPDVLADFPSNQFNHAILLVPMNEDSLWLECTSQTVPFGHIGAGNEDRTVLVIAPDGGRLVRTQRSDFSQNQQMRRGRIKVAANGDARASVDLIYSGHEQDEMRWDLVRKSPRDREKWLRRQFDVPRVNVVMADFSEVDERRLAVTLRAEVEFPKLATRTGRLMFLRPAIVLRWNEAPRAMEKRTQPVNLRYPFVDADTLTFEIPGNFALDSVPEPIEVETSFASYRASVIFENGGLVYRRCLEIREHKLPAEQYEAYRQFVAAVVKADRTQVVLSGKAD